MSEMEAKTFKVDIFNKSYLLTTDEHNYLIEQALKRLKETAVSAKLSEETPPEDVAALIAFKLALQAESLQEQIDHQINHIQALIELVDNTCSDLSS